MCRLQDFKSRLLTRIVPVLRRSRIMTKASDSQTTSDAASTGKDVSSSITPTSSTPPESVIKPDIEHALVEDNPRIWSSTRKVGFLFGPSG